MRALLPVASLVVTMVACGHRSEPEPAGQPAAKAPVADPASIAKAPPPAASARATGVLVWIHGAQPLSEPDALDLEDQVRTQLAEHTPQVAFDVRRTVSEGEVKGASHYLELIVRDTLAPDAKGSAGPNLLAKRELDVRWSHGEDPPFTLEHTPELPPDHPGSAAKTEDPLLLAQVHANHALAHDLAARLPKL